MLFISVIYLHQLQKCGVELDIIMIGKIWSIVKIFTIFQKESLFVSF